MKTLYLIRHAKSSWNSSAQLDRDRPLNERGLRTAPFMAEMLKKTGVRPDFMVASPANRALTTALFFAKTFGIGDGNFQTNPTIYEAWPEDILAIAQGLPNVATVAFLFGHNPTMTDLANRFSQKYIDNVPTCGIVRIEAAIDAWTDFQVGSGAVTALFFPRNYLADADD